MTPKAFTDGLTLLGDIYPRELSDAARTLYAQTCGHLADDVWAEAIRRCVATRTFYPVPAEILAAAEAVAIERAGIAAPDDAWRAVQAVARGWYPGQTVRGSLDPLALDALRDIGGIAAVAGAESIELGRLARQFRAAYESAARPYVDAAARGALDAPPLETAAIEAPGSSLARVERP